MHQPLLRGVGFSREPIPASLPHVDSQVPGCALALIAGVLDGDEADNQERVKIGNATPDFDPSIIARDDGSHVVSEALKSFMSAARAFVRISLPRRSMRLSCGT